MPLQPGHASSHSLLHCQSRRAALAATMLLLLMATLSVYHLGSRLQPGRISPANRPLVVSIRPAGVQVLEKLMDPGPASPLSEPFSTTVSDGITASIPEVKLPPPQLRSPSPKRPLEAKQPAPGSKNPLPAVAQTAEALSPDSTAKESTAAKPVPPADFAAAAAGGPPSATNESSRAAKPSGHPIASQPNSSVSQAAAEGNQTEKAVVDQIIAALVAVVEQHKRYPQAAKRAGYEGTVTISVRIDRHGFIRGYELTCGSGRSVLDDSALMIFRRIGDIRIAAVSIDRDLTLVVPVRYALNPGA